MNHIDINFAHSSSPSNAALNLFRNCACWLWIERRSPGSVQRKFAGGVLAPRLHQRLIGFAIFAASGKAVIAIASGTVLLKTITLHCLKVSTNAGQQQFQNLRIIKDSLRCAVQSRHRSDKLSIRKMHHSSGSGRCGLRQPETRRCHGPRFSRQAQTPQAPGNLKATRLPMLCP